MGAPKNRKAGLDRPLKVGGGIQPQLVTVLTPATTCAVDVHFSQNGFAVNRRKWLFVFQTILFDEISLESPLLCGFSNEPCSS